MAGLRLSVRQRWCSLLSETVFPHQPHPNHSRLPSLSSTQRPKPHFVRLVSTVSALSHSPVPISPPTAVVAPSLAPPPSDSHDQFHTALTLAGRAAHLGHPHAVMAIIETLHQQPNTAPITHPAFHNQLLRAYLHCHTLPHQRRYERMVEVWIDMQAEDITCNERTYTLLLNGCIRKHRQLLKEQPTSPAHAHTVNPATAFPSTTATATTQQSCLQECLKFMKGVPMSTSLCNLLIKAALLSSNHAYPFVLFQQCFPPLLPNTSTLSLLVDAALVTPSSTAHGGVNSAMEWYVKVTETGRTASKPAVAGTPAMYAKLMRRCLQNASGTREVQHVPVLFSHMEETGVRAEAEHIRYLLLALSRLQLNGASWGVWQKMETERRVQRTDETDALMLRVMSEEKDHKRAMQVILSIEQRWTAAPPTTTRSSVVYDYRSAVSNFSRNGHSTTLLTLLSHVFSSRYSSAVLRGGLLESVVRRWCEAGRGVDELRTKVRQWVAAVDMSEQEMDGWQTLADILAQRRHQTAAVTAPATGIDGDHQSLLRDGLANGHRASGEGVGAADLDESAEAKQLDAAEPKNAEGVATVTVSLVGNSTVAVDSSAREEDTRRYARAVHVSELSVDDGFDGREHAVMVAASGAER